MGVGFAKGSRQVTDCLLLLPFRQASQVTHESISAQSPLQGRGASQTRLLSVVLVLVCGPPAQSPMAARCGTERWPVKVMADSDAGRIDTMPMPTSVTELGDLPRPTIRLPENRRLSPYELEIWRLRARSRQALVESDGDLHLVLEDTEDSSRTMIAEIPDSACAEGSLYAGRFAAARRELRTIPRNAIIELDGVGFFDFLHGQQGVAPNGFELHPILAIRVVATSDTTDFHTGRPARLSMRRK